MADRAMNNSQRDQRAEPFEDDLPADPVFLLRRIRQQYCSRTADNLAGLPCRHAR
jgi:hypothetical protein